MLISVSVVMLLRACAPKAPVATPTKPQNALHLMIIGIPNYLYIFLPIIISHVYFENLPNSLQLREISASNLSSFILVLQRLYTTRFFSLRGGKCVFDNVFLM
jgi:hypothetical protein